MMKADKVRDLSAASFSQLCSGILFITLTLVLTKGVTAESNSTGIHCHWCGPRAEQVHRSRRASDCDPNSLQTQVTACDTGYDYCAIVVTTPPYTESRYCVKLYQDECYPLYCNTTDTWRITCPCKGNLCNGANTEREINAFAALSKLAIKNTTPSNRRKTTKNHTNIVKRDVDSAINDPITTTPSSEIQDTSLANNDNIGETNNKKTCATADESTNAEKLTTSASNVEINEVKKLESVTPNDDSSNEIDCEYDKDIQKADAVTVTEVQNELPIEEQKPVESSSTLNVNTSPSPKISSHEDNNLENKIDDNPATLPPVIMETKITEPLQIENQISEVESSIVHHGSSEVVKEITNMEVNPSISLPTAEALQHNVTPITINNIDKTTESTTSEITTTIATTIRQHETTTLSPHKNGVSRYLNNKNLIIIVTFVFLLNILKF